MQCSLMLALVALVMSIAGASASRTLQQGGGPPLEVRELLPPQWDGSSATGGPAADAGGFTPGSAKKVSSVGKSERVRVRWRATERLYPLPPAPRYSRANALHCPRTWLSARNVCFHPQIAGSLLKGPNKEKLARPEPNAKFARDSYVVAVSPDTSPEDIEALMKYVLLCWRSREQRAPEWRGSCTACDLDPSPSMCVWGCLAASQGARLPPSRTSLGLPSKDSPSRHPPAC